MLCGNGTEVRLGLTVLGVHKSYGMTDMGVGAKCIIKFYITVKSHDYECILKISNTAKTACILINFVRTLIAVLNYTEILSY